ncbi:MAG: sortase [Clostridia bacterium]|nr:sortase [Clostridia bacterium]
MNKVLRWLILIILFLILLFMLRGISLEAQIKTGKDTQNIQEETHIEEDKEKVKNKTKVVATQYKGHKVAANLQIEKLKIDTCVLEDYTKNAMEICVTKFFGPNPNEIGNFCITGHNYITKNMFGYLYTLKNGDILTLTDNENGTIKYEIYDKYKVKPNQTYGLSQRTNGKREVTLITCCNYSNERLIIKAREV